MLVLNIVLKGSGLQVLVGRRPHSFLRPEGSSDVPERLEAAS